MIGLAAISLLAFGASMDAAHAQVDVAQEPLTVSNNVPGNVVLTPSVEWPTVMSMSNLHNFDGDKTYGGYFDPDKCYTYDPDGAIPTSTPAPQQADPKGETGYFVPASVSGTSPATCSGQWSGNYLNWAATQTIDTFRSVMTGGYRVIDTTTLTVLEKARHTGQTGTGKLKITGSSTVSSNTPTSFQYFYTRLNGLGNKMYFMAGDSTNVKRCDSNGHHCTDGDSLKNWLDNPGSYGVEPYKGTIKSGHVYSVNIDVQVCKSGLLESNCVAYGSNYKPEGMIQKYSKTLKYSVFGYLNISGTGQDGAALRASQKFVGPKTYDPIAGEADNTAKEWDPDTGILVVNPNATDATNTTTSDNKAIVNSGVINYLNKFGEMYGGDDKSNDPVSEMYYAAIRYLKHQDPVASYSKYNAGNPSAKQADGFPVITSDSDPIKYMCQKNFILGIGDVNTWNDKNLPGNTDTDGEPSAPAEVTADTTVNVVTALNKIAQLEGITINTPFTGRENSAYIAALAYDSHTKDMRSDFDGDQTASTYWVDVEENQVLAPISKNQYLLATKYGGFDVPANFNPYTRTAALDESWWTSGDMLTTSNIDEKRPRNFFEGGDAAAMRSGLNAAFSAIASANQGSQASLSLNSTQGSGANAVYWASYVEGSWTGSMQSFAIDSSTDEVATVPTWTASVPAYATRKVYTVVGGAYKAFNTSNVSGGDWSADVVNYIRGDSSKEIRNGGTLRNRSTVLGDIVHSQPVYVGKPNAYAFGGSSFTGLSDYPDFVADESSRTPVVYIAANDGMLHGFNADTGVETYAFMPGAVLSATVNPSVLAEANYGSGINPHQFFNDGQVTVAPVYYSSAWHTVLVGTTGRGEAKSIYALDITDPANVSFLWEISGASNADVGQMTGKPIIAKTADGWAVLIGNGYNSTNNTAALLRITLDGGTPTTTVYTTNTTTDNGLATPGVWVGNSGAYEATEAYAGDLLGNVWKFDLTATSGAGTLVFSTPGNQPITVPILLGKNGVSGHLWAFFGTGKNLAVSDLSDTSTQSWYGMMVDGTLPVQSSDLVKREIVTQTNGTPADPNATPPTTAVAPARALSEGTTGDMSGKSGWYMDLVPPSPASAEGERMLVRNQFVDGYLVGTTWIPVTTNACAPGGKGWVMVLDPFTGTNPDDIYFDLNEDGLFNNQDKVTNGSNSDAAGGIGFDSLTGLPAFTSGAMHNNRNVGGAKGIGTTKTSGGASAAIRVSWRELVN